MSHPYIFKPNRDKINYIIDVFWFFLNQRQVTTIIKFTPSLEIIFLIFFISFIRNFYFYVELLVSYYKFVLTMIIQIRFDWQQCFCLRLKNSIPNFNLVLLDTIRRQYVKSSVYKHHTFLFAENDGLVAYMIGREGEKLSVKVSKFQKQIFLVSFAMIQALYYNN